MKFYDVAIDYIERMEYLEQGINACQMIELS